MQVDTSRCTVLGRSMEGEASTTTSERPTVLFQSIVTQCSRSHGCTLCTCLIARPCRLQVVHVHPQWAYQPRSLAPPVQAKGTCRLASHSKKLSRLPPVRQPCQRHLVEILEMRAMLQIPNRCRAQSSFRTLRDSLHPSAGVVGGLAAARVGLWAHLTKEPCRNRQ